MDSSVQMGQQGEDGEHTRLMDWVLPFYGYRGTRMGPTGVFESHRARAASIERLCGQGKKRVLDLGAGAGGTSAAIAELGHEVIAIEVEPVRAEFCRDLAAEPRAGMMTVVEESYFDVELEGQFDVVGHWDSFGMGSDADQRTLLRRVAYEWLAPGGRLLLDVFNPFWWAARHGEVEQAEWCGMAHRIEFDPLTMRFVDTWWADGDEANAQAQRVRCYGPVDFLLLLEGTGLAPATFEADDTPFTLNDDAAALPMWRDDVMSYLVVLARQGEL